MRILSKLEYAEHLHNYYTDHYGERDTDIWYEQSAVNVWVFGRDGKTISLKSHILTGDVTEHIEESL